MWPIILLSICTASIKFIGADEPRGLPQVAAPVQNLQYSSPLNSPLPYSPPSNYAPTNLGDKVLKVPSAQSEINRQFQGSQISPSNCPQLETLESILILLKHILNQNDNAHFTQPDKRIQILQYLKQFLEMSGSRVSEIENHEKLNELIHRAYKSLLVDNNTSFKTTTDNNNNHKNHVEANLIFKYDVPNINNIDCKKALATLIQTVKDAHLQLINYCKQTRKCNVNLDPLHLQYSDQSNNLHDSATLGQPMPGEAKIPILDPNLLNNYGIPNSGNNLVNANNQIRSQNDLNNKFGNRLRQQLDLNGNQFLNTNNINSGIFQTLNNQERKNVEAYNNIYLNKKTIQSNQLLSDQSNTLNGFVSFHEPLSTQAQKPAVDPNPFNIQNPLNNLVVIPYTQGDLSQRISDGYFNLQEQPLPYLNWNQLQTNGALNAGIVETENKQEKNIDISNNRYLNTLNNNDITRFVYTPQGGNKYFQTYNSIPLLPNSHVQRYLPTTYNNEVNQQLYKLSQTVNDNRQSLAYNNLNKQDTKEQIQYNTAAIPNQYYNPNSWSYIKPNEVQTYASPDLTLTNPQVNLDKFPNQNVGLINPPFHSSLKTEQSPYLSSINLNRQNNFNYNSQQADASVKSNYGLNLHTSSNLADYPKHDIYGNTLVDSQRLASASNLAKLNSADNAGIVELTYKLKRPQSLNYNPYYYLKFRMPYSDFVAKVTDITKNQNVRSDPLKFHRELLSVSNLSNLKETTSDLKNIQQDELSKLIANNGGTLINAQVLGTINDTKANEYLKTIQNLNAKLRTHEILNLVEHDKSYNQPMSIGSGIPASVNTLQPQYNFDLQQRRLIPGLNMPSTGLKYNIKALPLTFLPAVSSVILNPEIPQRMYTTFE